VDVLLPCIFDKPHSSFNSKSELVGVNFDRTFEATINDFAWNESYSRSIGVDIRYVLWITGIA